MFLFIILTNTGTMHNIVDKYIYIYISIAMINRFNLVKKKKMSIVYCVPFNIFSQRMKLDDKKTVLRYYVSNTD